VKAVFLESFSIHLKALAIQTLIVLIKDVEYNLTIRKSLPLFSKAKVKIYSRQIQTFHKKKYPAPNEKMPGIFPAPFIPG
jgi:hypothetical protein